MTDAPPPPVPPVPATPATPPAGSPSSYPVTLDFDGELDVQNWRPLVNWLLAIPHWIVLWVLGIIAFFLWIAGLFTVLFTQRNPFVGFQTMYLRYYWRVVAFSAFMRNDYPPFDFDTVLPDNGLYAAKVSAEDPGDMNRWLVLVKWLLAIPHYIVLWFLGIAAAVVILISLFQVLFTGTWNESMRNFVIGYWRWTTRVTGYFLFITDPYPPFSLQP
jgi:hypothetical protein